MKPEYVSPTLLVLVYCILVAAGIYNLFSEAFSLIRVLFVATNAIILSALLVISGRWAISAGVLFCWVKMAIGAVIVLIGIWEIVTLDPLNGLFLIAIGLIAGIGLAYWTLVTLYAVARQPQQPV